MLGAAVGTVALVAPAIAVRPAAADDCTSLYRCDLNQTQTLIVPMRNKTLAALLEIRNTDRARRLYRQLLPPGYSMPVHPMIGLYTVTIDVPTKTIDPIDQGVRGVADITHYLEGSLSLRTVRNGESGWLHLGMPVDSEQARTSGLGEGYPKYHATLRFEPQGAGWFSNDTVSGRQTLKMAWRPASVPISKDLQSFLGEPFYTLAKPLRGPQRWRTRLTAFSPVPLQQLADGADPGPLGVSGVTKIPDQQAGLMDVAIDPDLNRYKTGTHNSDPTDDMPDLLGAGQSLSDLVDTTQTVPGVFDEFQQTLLYQMNREADPMTQANWWQVQRHDGSASGSGTGSHGGSAASQGGARATCASRRKFTIRLARGMRSASVVVGGRRATVVRRGGRLTAVVDLRGRAAGGRVIVRIRGRMAHGSAHTSRRVYRVCATTRR